MEPPTAPNVHNQPLRRNNRHHQQQQQNDMSPSASIPSNPSSIAHPQPRGRRDPRIAPFSSVGQFSFAPTTQTTVVTTTTTTTMSFPQLVMRPPRNLNELDPKEFPLAATPTPPNLKRLCFDLNGKRTHFRETDDPEQSLREVRIQSTLNMGWEFLLT